ncbi:MAG: hypothetical protein R2706_17920 [Acidimicrobiales bacterium]
MDERLHELIVDAENLAERIQDIAFDELREAMSKGATKRPESDRHFQAAIRAVRKAAGSLEKAASVDQ